MAAYFRKPRAATHLWHYLRGGGAMKEVSTRELLESDVRVRRVFLSAVRAALEKGITSSAVPIPQWQFSRFDWRCAVGSISLYWQREEDGIRTWFRDPYRWHPDSNRPTRLLHRIAERLKRRGAADYWMAGTPAHIPMTQVLAAAAPRPVPPRDRVYL